MSSRFQYLISCPESGLMIRAETVAIMGTDYWQYLKMEHGM